MQATATLDVVRFHDDPRAVLPDWQALADRVGTVFSSRPSFVLNVAQALRLDCTYLGVWRGSYLVAFVALSRVNRGPLALAKVVGTNLGVPLEILGEDSRALQTLLRAVAGRGYMLSADSMIADAPAVHELRRHSSWVVDIQVREHVPVVDVEPGRTASSIRSAKSLKRLRQYRSGDVPFRIEVVRTLAHLEDRWADIRRVADTAVDGTGKLNYLVSPHGEFAKDFLRDEARAGRLCIAGVVVDDVWSAHEIGVRTGHSMEGWLTHYDPRIARWQPGHQLIEWFANNHDALSVTRLDQGVGVNRIKSVWARSGYDVVRVSAVPRAWTVSALMLQVLRRVPPVLSWMRGTGARVKNWSTPPPR